MNVIFASGTVAIFRTLTIKTDKNLNVKSMPSFTTADADDLMQFQKIHGMAKGQGNNTFRKAKQFFSYPSNLTFDVGPQELSH